MRRAAQSLIVALALAAGVGAPAAAQVLKAEPGSGNRTPAPPPKQGESAADYLQRLMDPKGQAHSGSLTRVRELPKASPVVVLPQHRGALCERELKPVLRAVLEHLRARLQGSSVRVGTMARHLTRKSALRASSRDPAAVAALVDTLCHRADDAWNCSLQVTFIAPDAVAASWPRHLVAKLEGPAPATPEAFARAASALQEDNSTWFGDGGFHGKGPAIDVRYPTSSAELGEAAEAAALKKALAGVVRCHGGRESHRVIEVLAIIGPKGRTTHVESYLWGRATATDAAPQDLKCVDAAVKALRFEPDPTGQKRRRLSFKLTIARGGAVR
jgi:hypothetical protein